VYANPNLTKQILTRIIIQTNATFIHAGLITRYRKESLNKVLSCCQTRAIFCLWRG